MEENLSFFQKVKRDYKNYGWLFWVCILWTAGFLALQYIHFFRPEFTINPIMHEVYRSLVLAYTAQKEIGNWVNKPDLIKRPGEFVAAVWWVSALFMLAAETVSRGKYKYPNDLNIVLLEITAILILNHISKTVRIKKNNNNGNGNPSK